MPLREPLRSKRVFSYRDGHSRKENLIPILTSWEKSSKCFTHEDCYKYLWFCSGLIKIVEEVVWNNG